MPGIKGIISFTVFLLFGVPLFPRETHWEVDSEHSTARLAIRPDHLSSRDSRPAFSN